KKERTVLGEEANDRQKHFKFSKNAFGNFMTRSNLLVKRISSTKAVSNEEALERGIHWTQQLIELRKKGKLPTHGEDDIKLEGMGHCPLFEFFQPSQVVMYDEVPVNFLPEGSTVTESGQGAAVKSVTGTGKRFCSLIIFASTEGKLLKVVIIYKWQKATFNKTEQPKYDELEDVVVTGTKSSYVNQQVLQQKVVPRVLRQYQKSISEEDKEVQWLVVAADNHSSHYTAAVLQDLFDARMIPIFSPPNCTPWWCLIDDK